MAGEIAAFSTRTENLLWVFFFLWISVSNSPENFEVDLCVCVKGKCGKCKGKLKTNLQYEIVSKMDYSCVPKPAGIEIKVKLENYRKKKNREGMSVPVPTIYKEELSDI